MTAEHSIRVIYEQLRVVKIRILTLSLNRLLLTLLIGSSVLHLDNVAVREQMKGFARAHDLVLNLCTMPSMLLQLH